MKRILLIMMLVLGAGIVSCERRSREPNIELIQDMMESPAVKAQDEDANSMKLPPEGTIPQGWTPYNMKSPEEAESKLQNPFPADAENVLKGQKLFLTNCFSCHGALADGKGPIAEKWPAPIPSLRSQAVKDRKDGYIYHVMTVGRGLMSSYASQVRPDERWLIINYIRHVQKTLPVVETTAAK